MMSVKNIFLFLPVLLTSVSCVQVVSQVLNGLDVPADPVPVKIERFNSYSPKVSSVYHKSLQESSCPSEEDEWFLIQAKQNNLVVDAGEPNQIRLQYLSGSPQQLWRFERAGGPAVYYIINNSTGQALDVVSEKPNNAVTYAEPRRIPILKELDGSDTQKWATTWNGRLRNVGTKLNLDVFGTVFEPGNRVIVWFDSGIIAQEFNFQRRVK